MGVRGREVYLHICADAPPQVPSYAAADGPFVLISQGRFQEPLCSCQLS